MLKKLKSLFFQEIDTNDNLKENTDVQIENKIRPDTKVSSTNLKNGKNSEKMRSILLAAMEKHNLEGFDYIEFKASLSSLAKMNMDEPTMFKSAFAMAATMGVNKNELIQSASHYIDVLEQEFIKFSDAIQRQRQEKVEIKKLEVSKAKERMGQLKEQIEKMKSELEGIQKRIDSTNGGIEADVAKLIQTEANFNATFRGLTNTIKQDISKINNHIV